MTHSADLANPCVDANACVEPNPCVECGACCASFRVSFYWSEAEANGLPVDLTRQVNAFYSCMAGTETHPVRCVALQGTVGQQVSCSVYAQRPSPCRDVQMGDEQCAKARRKHGLIPLHCLEGAETF